MRALGAALLALAALSAPRPAAAQSRPVKLGVGLFAGGGVGWITAPSQGQRILFVQGTPIEERLYSGFSGPTFGGGAALDLRVLEALGVELDAFVSSERAGGDFESISAAGVPLTTTITIGQTALRLPLLAKAVVPWRVVRPFAVVGPELVLPGTSSAAADPPGRLSLVPRAYADARVALTGGLGAELALPFRGLDLRVPLSVRVTFDPALGSGISTRETIRAADLTPVRAFLKDVEYRSDWQWRVVFLAGAMVYF